MMRQLPRSTFPHEVHASLQQAWSPSHATNAPQSLLPLSYEWLSDRLPTPDTTGLLFAFLHCIGTVLPAYLSQGASPLDTIVYLDDVSTFTSEYGVATGFDLGIPFQVYTEMNDLIVEVMHRIYWEILDAEDLEQKRYEILASADAEMQKTNKLAEHTWRFTAIYLQVLIETHIPLFLQRWTPTQYADFASSFVRGLHSGATIPIRSHPSPDLTPIDFKKFLLVPSNADAELDLHEPEYAPTGPRIPLNAFCHPILIDTPRAERCAICGTDVADVQVGDHAVVTACGHFFHAGCLGSWVNASAAESANMCPVCRGRMCDARGRVRVDVDVDYDSGEEEEEDELASYVL